jgi:integrase/recombinase XerD
VKAISRLAADRLRARGPDWQVRADQPACASAHWLWHTAGSRLTDRQVDLRFLCDNAGHASLATTNVYLRTEDGARHEATQMDHRLGWA